MTFYRLLLFVLILFPCHQTFASTEGENHLPNDVQQVKFAGLDWSTSYGAAYAEAKASKKMFLIHFVPAGENVARENVAVKNLETTISNNRQLQKKLSNFVLANLPIDTE